MGNTANLVLPYPEDTDPLANMAAAVQALAEALDADLVTGTGWTAVAFANGWVNFGAPWQTVQYKRVGKRVYVRGMMKSGAGSAFTLPAGYRPPADLAFPCIGNGGFGYVSITSAGVCTPVGSNISFHINFTFDTV